jgi:hypothetical protein
MLCFFRSLIDFYWIKGHLISGRVGSGRDRVGLDQFDFIKKLGQIGFGSGRIGRVSRVGSVPATSMTAANPLSLFKSIDHLFLVCKPYYFEQQNQEADPYKLLLLTLLIKCNFHSHLK